MKGNNENCRIGGIGLARNKDPMAALLGRLTKSANSK